MAEYIKNVIESVLLQDTLTKNLHYGFAGDALSFIESAKTQHHMVDVAEHLTLQEAAPLGPGIHHETASDVLSLSEVVQPRVLIYDAFDGLVLSEFAAGPNYVNEGLIITEQVIVSKASGVLETLTLVETLGLNIFKAMIVSEIINLSEGVVGVLYRQGIPIPITPFNIPPSPYVTGIFITETPIGVINGANPTFTLSFTPLPGPVKLQVYVNGVLQTLGVDYNFAGATITFIAGAVPQTGDTMIAYYTH